MKDKVLDFFGWYSLYATPITGFAFDFDQKSMVLNLENYDDTEQKTVALKLWFKGLQSFSFTYPADEFSLSHLSVYRFEIAALDKGYQIRLAIDMERVADGMEFTVGEIIIGFQDFEHEGGLSREEMEKKWG